MPVDEMQSLWQQMDRRIEAMAPSLRLTERLARTSALDRVRAKLRFAHGVAGYELACGVLVALLAGSYLGDQIGTLRFALPAVGLLTAGILSIAFPAWQLAALARLDVAGPVLETQRRLAELRLVRARGNRWLLLAAPLLWALLAVVVPHALVGLDVYRAFGIAWVGGNFAFGIAVLAAAAWASRRFPGARFFAALGDDLTGRRLAAAAGSLDELSEFEREG